MNMLKKIAAWCKDETSVSVTSEKGMLMLGGILTAIGIGWLTQSYMKTAGNNILGTMSDTADTGIDPNTPPSVVSGWAN